MFRFIFTSVISVAVLWTSAAIAQEPLFHAGRMLNENPDYLQKVKETHPKLIVIYIANDEFQKRNELWTIEKLVKTDSFGEKLRLNWGYVAVIMRNGMFDQDSAHSGQPARKKTEFSDFKNFFTEMDRNNNLYKGYLKKQFQDLRKVTIESPSHMLAPERLGGIVTYLNGANEFNWGEGNPYNAHFSHLKFNLQRYARGEKKDDHIYDFEAGYEPAYPQVTVPLVDRDTMRKLLLAIQKRMEESAEEGEKFRYVLVVRSYGDRKSVVAPGINHNLMKPLVSQERILQAAKKVVLTPNSETQVHDADESALQRLPVIKQLVEHLKNDGGPLSEPVPEYRKIDLLLDLANSGMEIPLIIWDSPQSGLEYSLEEDEGDTLLRDVVENSRGNKVTDDGTNRNYEIQSFANFRAKNLGMLYTTRDVRYRADELDFSKLLDPDLPYFRDDDLQDAIAELMDDLSVEASASK